MEIKEQRRLIFNLIVSFIFVILLIGYFISESQPDMNDIFRRLIEGFILLLFAYSIFTQQEN